MRASLGTYEKVAERCSAYSPENRGDALTSAAEDYTSCISCRHFSTREYCKLDLYDQIVNSISSDDYF